MRGVLRSRKGQLLLPMLALIFLFGLFLAGFLKWCQAVYWQMRTNMVAEAVALSAGRAQAEMLNSLAILQGLENAFLQKVDLFGADVAHMQVELDKDFETTNQVLRSALRGFNGQTMAVAQAVARANGVKVPAIPSPKPDHHLEPQKVYVLYFAKLIPVWGAVYEKAYFLRKWSPGKACAQPDHEVTWGVKKQGAVGTATARLWLDLTPESVFDNGGFPGKDLPWVRQIGIQCFFPQFNARLVPTSKEKDAALRGLLAGL